MPEAIHYLRSLGPRSAGSFAMLSFFFISFFFLAVTASSQTIVPSDTSKAAAAKRSAKVKRPGFDLPDSLFIARDSVRGDIDTIVYYTARDSSVFEVAKKKMTLTGDATLDYQVRNLQAYRIVMDFPKNTLLATSAAFDSVITTNMGKQRRVIRDTARVQSRGAPKLMDGPTPYEGEVILYNLKTKQGTVQLGTTTMQGGYYYGEKIKQVEPKTLFVENGRYTTCSQPTPHYYFESPRMKVISGDQVFAAPVYLYIADVPVFWLPFAVFPNHASGRTSGIIAPNYSTTGSRGFGLTHLGYYEVFDDYFDALVRTDLYTKGGYNLNFVASYMKRYLLGGPINLSLGYSKTRYSSIDPYATDFELSFVVPTLNINPVTTFSTNLHFQSNGYAQNNAQNINDVLQQTANSAASFNTTLDDIGFSLSAGYQRNQNLRTSEYSESSPTISFSRISPIYIFGDPSASTEASVLQTVQLNYSGSFSRGDQKTLHMVAGDSLHRGDTSFVYTSQMVIAHSPSLSIQPKVGYISLTPSVSYSEDWLFRAKTKTPKYHIETFNGRSDTTIVFDETYDNGFHRVNRYSFSLAASTTMYGIANIGAFGIKALRHTLQPSISFTLTPDVSSQEVQTYTDLKTGQLIRYSKYEEDLGAGGYAMGARSGTMGFSLGNDFEAKVEHKVNADSSTEEKIKVLNLNFGSGYDLIQKIFSPLNVSMSTQIGTFLAISGNAQYSFYPRGYLGNDSTEHTLLYLGKGILRANNVAFSLSGGFASSTSTEGDNIDSLRRFFQLKTPEDERLMYLGGNYPGAFISIPFRPKWNANYGISYTESYSFLGSQKNLSANLSFSLSLTKNWSFTTSAAYDLVSRQIVVPNLRIHRDLDCWELNFDYRPTGIIRGFNFELRLKAPELRDIKLTRQESTYGQF
ncbi:MAG: putative LPS assembly protein LptD [Bacteroidota bacterium]|nr:putative LPS assembly protein LptD [Bacteroidota bacterium]